MTDLPDRDEYQYEQQRREAPGRAPDSRDIDFLNRSILGLERNFIFRLDAISTKLTDAITEMRSSYATKNEVTGLKEEIEKIKENQGWVVKLIIGVVIAAVLGLVIVKGGPSGIAALHG